MDKMKYKKFTNEEKIALIDLMIKNVKKFNEADEPKTKRQIELATYHNCKMASVALYEVLMEKNITYNEM